MMGANHVLYARGGGRPSPRSSRMCFSQCETDGERHKLAYSVSECETQSSSSSANSAANGKSIVDCCWGRLRLIDVPVLRCRLPSRKLHAILRSGSMTTMLPADSFS